MGSHTAAATQLQCAMEWRQQIGTSGLRDVPSQETALQTG
jgi:hypothetical protein